MKTDINLKGPAYAVWVDRDQAKLFSFPDELDSSADRRMVRAFHFDHHTHRTDAIDHQRWSRNLFGQVVEHLGAADRIFVMGPGVAKHHFYTYLVEHHPNLAKVIVGCETVNHPTENEIEMAARKLLKIEESPK